MTELFLSAEGLCLNGKPATKNVFIVVCSESITSHTTPMTSGGAGFHSWRIGGVRHARKVHRVQVMKGENCKEDEGPAGTGP
ncbi:putative BON1-associated protein 1-like [Sesbania bispinosa]|nr:putative BON1-associated protein 1-like [Sesbania bispinosa]